jgi:hypothetical protein
LESKNKDQKILLIKNNKPFLDGRKAVQISQHQYDESVIKSLDDNKKVFGISTSKKDLRNLEIKINTETTDKKIKIYDCDSDKKDLLNVNETWQNADAVMFTSTIMTAVSYTAEPSFDVAYANLLSTNLARDGMQMILRARHLNDNILYFSVNNKRFAIRIKSNYMIALMILGILINKKLI